MSGSRILQFSIDSSPRSRETRRRKQRGVPTCSPRSLPLLELCNDRAVPERLLNRLKRLDPEQLQIVEIVAIAIARGAA